MLEKLGGQISDCLLRAAEARRRAEATTDARLTADFLDQERNWHNLAESYRFAESLDRFLGGDLALADGWQPASSAPFDRQIELAVFDGHATHTLVFPCCRVVDGWIEARTRRHVDVVPTHWREWMELAPRNGHGQPGENANTGNDSGLVVFENEHASLRIARGEDNSLELVVRVHGEEITAYDLDGDQLAAIGSRLLTLARKADPHRATPSRPSPACASGPATSA
jgi:hypothetical protein